MKIFIERPVATAMVFLSLLMLGVYSFLNTPIELVPKEELPKVYVNTSWTGVPPEIIQTQVTAPIEEICAAVKGVRKISSISQIGLSRITLDFDPKADMEFATLALREELAKARAILPAFVRPAVVPFVPDEFREEPLLQYTISGGYTLHELREIVKDKLENGLGAIRGVTRVDIMGGSEPEILVAPDEAKLKAYNIQPYQINFAISERLRTYPSGRVRRGNQEFLFKFTDRITDLKELEETVVGSSGKVPIRIKDVAAVGLTYGDVYSIHRINGQPTVSLSVHKEGRVNTLKIAREVKRKLEQVRRELPADLVFKSVVDESEEIGKNLKDLYILAGVIAVLVFLMIFLILRRFLPSLLILSSIAFSVVITFNLLYAMGMSLNMLTLGALALGFGMFVDDSIVVFENILRLRETGVPAKEAALRGSREVFVAVLASTLTTVAVFGSFPFFQGRLKVFYLPLAWVIGSALIASLLVSFTLIPALSPRLIERRKGTRVKEPRIRRGFARLSGALLGHPVEVLLVVGALLFGSYKWFKAEVTIGRWPSWYQKQYITVYMGMPAGTDIARTDESIRKFEDHVVAQPYGKEMNARIFPEQAQIQIGFPPEVERSYIPYVLKEELIQLATQFAGLSISVGGFDQQSYYSSMGAGTMYGSRIKFYGYNLKKLKEITGDLTETLKRNPRVKEVRTVSSRGWYSGETLEDILKIDKAALRKYDIDPLYLYGHIQTLIRGNFGSPARIRTGDREIVVSVKFPQSARIDMRGLQNALIRSRSGEYFRLGEVATFTELPIAGSIDRENQQFQQTIMWEFRGPAKAEERYRKAVFASLHLAPGFSATLDETWYMTTQEKEQLAVAIAVSLVVIFMILAALYESFVHPFLILMAVPLGLIGVFAAFVLAKAPFDPTAYIGVILLGGIVVKNSILLVDHINLKRKQGLDLREAVVQGTRDRVRPIFMTASTTVFGMLPMLLIGAEANKRQIWSSLALCTVGGLTTSTLLVLVVIPILYYHSDRLRVWAAEKAREVRGVWVRKPPAAR